jgi:hypothetical protein
MGIISRVIKIAGIEDDDGEMVGGTVGEQMTRRTMHGRTSQWDLRRAQGNLMRGNEKPKPVPWSRDKRKP